MSEVVEQAEGTEQQQKIGQLEAELGELTAGLEQLKAEQQEREERRKELANAGDNTTLLERVRSQKPQSATSAHRVNEARLAEIPNLLGSLQRRIVEKELEIAGERVVLLEQETLRLSKVAFEEQDKYLQAELARDMAQSHASAAVHDRDEARRRVHQLQQRLASMDLQAPVDPIEQQLAARGVWRWRPQ